MSGQTYERFFLHPSDPIHRRYEALRAVFVDKLPMEEVAGRFDVHYGTVRNWASEFRAQHDARQPPFFSRAATPSRMPNKITRSHTPMSKHCP
jgi:transposase-like protein